jgi:uncharacterized repeat protein (TIGR02543 family)
LFSQNFSIVVSAGPSFTVTFNSQGGSAVASASAIPGTTITAPTPPDHPGYAFAGWYKEAACVNVWDFATDTVTSDITLYAKWAVGDVPGAVTSLEITGFPLTAAPRQSFEVSVAYGAAGGGQPNPAPVLSTTLDAAGAALAQVQILSANSARVTALPQTGAAFRGAPNNSAIYGDALVNFTATQTVGGSTLQKSAAVPLVIADGLLTPVTVTGPVRDEFGNANRALASSGETILPGNVQPRMTALDPDWQIINSLGSALVGIDSPDAYVLPECFEPTGRDAARLEIDMSGLVPSGKKGLLPLTFRVRLKRADVAEIFGAGAADRILSSPGAHLDEIFTKIVIQKEIMEGERRGWYTRLVNGVLKPAEAVEKGILEVTGGDALTLTLSYYVLDDSVLEAFVRGSYLIVPDGHYNNKIFDPIWVNKWKPGYAPGGSMWNAGYVSGGNSEYRIGDSGGGAGGGSSGGGSGCASRRGAASAVAVVLLAFVIFRREGLRR